MTLLPQWKPASLDLRPVPSDVSRECVFQLDSQWDAERSLRLSSYTFTSAGSIEIPPWILVGSADNAPAIMIERSTDPDATWATGFPQSRSVLLFSICSLQPLTRSLSLSLSLFPLPAVIRRRWRDVTRCSGYLSYRNWSAFVVIGRCVTSFRRIESDRIGSDRIGSRANKHSSSPWLSRAGRTESDICRWLALISPLTLIRPLFRRWDRQYVLTRWGPWLADLCGKKGPIFL